MNLSLRVTARSMLILSFMLSPASGFALRGDGQDPPRPRCNTDELKKCWAENAAARDASLAAALAATTRRNKLSETLRTLSESDGNEQEELRAVIASAKLAASEGEFLSSSPSSEKDFFLGELLWMELIPTPLRRAPWETAALAPLLEKFSTLARIFSEKARDLLARQAESRKEIEALSSEMQALQSEAHKQDQFARQHAYECQTGCQERICPANF